MIFENILLPGTLDEWITQGKSFQLVDMTEENLLSKFNIESNWIPAGKLLEQTNQLNKEVPVILCCHHGESSFIFMNLLFYHHNFQNVYSLKSGIKGWKSI
jgi:rhodanese-related sulfurtransferase